MPCLVATSRNFHPMAMLRSNELKVAPATFWDPNENFDCSTLSWSSLPLYLLLFFPSGEIKKPKILASRVQYHSRFCLNFLRKRDEGTKLKSYVNVALILCPSIHSLISRDYFHQQDLGDVSPPSARLGSRSGTGSEWPSVISFKFDDSLAFEGPAAPSCSKERPDAWSQRATSSFPGVATSTFSIFSGGTGRSPPPSCPSSKSSPDSSSLDPSKSRNRLASTKILMKMLGRNHPRFLP